MSDDELRSLAGRTFMRRGTGGIRTVVGVEELPNRIDSLRVYGVVWKTPGRNVSHKRSRASVFACWMRTAVEITDVPVV